jgi:hypothetical protein
MDQAASDDKISLRTYADQLCPDEAAALKGPIIWDHSNRIGLAVAPTLALARSNLRAMAEAIVDAAADGRCAIWRDGVRLPASFFVYERAAALALIKPALEQDDSLFRVRPSGRRLKARAGGANRIDDAVLLRKVLKRGDGISVRAAVIANIGSDMTEQQQDTIVHRIQRKLRNERKS